MSLTTFYGSQNLVGIGSVGIGTTSPGTALDVYTGTVNVATVTATTFYGTLAGSNTIASSNILVAPGRPASIVQGTNVFVFSNASGFSNVVVMNSLGQVGIGTTSPAAALDVYTGTVNVATVTATTFYGTLAGSNTIASSNILVAPGRPASIVQGTNVFVFSNASGFSNVMVMNSLGQVGIGTTNPASYTLQVAGTIGASGDITAFYSDDRLKNRTGSIENALVKVASLDTFTYVNNDLAKSFGFTDEIQKVGVSAQQVQKVLPEAVKRAPFDAGSTSGENYLTVQYDKIVPLLIEALKEEKSKRESLEKRVVKLENK